MAKVLSGVIEGPAISRTNKELAQAILGGEMRNAWEQETHNRQDLRPADERSIDRRPRDDAFRQNYPRIFGHE